MEKSKNKVVYILSFLYMLSAYAGPLTNYIMNHYFSVDNALGFIGFFFPLPIAIISALYLAFRFREIDRGDLLGSAVLVKYLLIPLFIIGGALILMLALLMFTPVVIMIFVSPPAIALLLVLGWCYMVGGSIFMWFYLAKSGIDGKNHKVLCVIGCILQVFFAVDVITTMFFTFKEKKCVGPTVAVIVIAVLTGLAAALGFVATLIWAFT